MDCGNIMEMEEKNKKIEISDRLFLAFFVLIVGILAYLITLAVFNFQSLPQNYPKELTVSGEGRAFAAPDIALLQLGVISEGMSIKKVIEDNTEKMNAILQEIKDLGVEEKDIQTTNYSLTPRYDWIEGERVFRGYTLNQEINVKIRNFEKIGLILEGATGKGANLVGDLQFTVDDLEKVRESARREAIEKAKAKANQISTASGLKLGKITNLYEDFYGIPYQATGLGGAMKEAATSAAQVPPQIQAGENEITVSITLVYQLK